MGSGGGGTQYVESKTETSNLPEYARPYYEGMLQQAQGLLQGGTYTPYEGQRIADFNANQLGTQGAIMNYQSPSALNDSTNMATQAAVRALTQGQYAPAQFGAQQIGLPQLLNYTMNAPQQVASQAQNAPTFNAAQTGYAGQAGTGLIDPNQLANVNAAMMSGAQTGYNPNVENYTTGLPSEFGQAEADKYMSPYIQSVIDVGKRKAMEEAQSANIAGNLGSARQGAYGGSRNLLAQTERERSLKERMGDIQAQGMQSAFENAQQQFERDRTANQAAQQFNAKSQLESQGQRLNVGLQTALANLSADQQARVANQAAMMQAQGLNADQSIRAALANQQTGLQASLANQQTGLQAALANLDAQSQANVQNQAAILQSQGLNQQQALQAALANQQAGLTTGQANLQSLLNTQQLGATTGLDALKANQTANLEAQRMSEASRQFGANQGLAALQQATQSAATAGNLGQIQQNMDFNRMNAQQQVGQQQQQMSQQYLDNAYADFLRQRDYPVEMLQYYNAILRGLPVTPNSVQTTYAPPPSMASQVLGTGLGALGLANSLGKA